MGTEMTVAAERLRQEGMARVRANQPEEALELFDQALRFSDLDDEFRELVTINRAGAFITLERQSPEVQQLPAIIMRRRSPRHVYLAAYNLHNKFAIAGDFKKATSYARLALSVAEETGEPEWRIEVLFALGILSGLESRFDEAIQFHQDVLEASPAGGPDAFRRASTLQNLGYSFIMNGQARTGIGLIEESMALMAEMGVDGYLAESSLDLCLAYLELSDLDQARSYGETGLDRAVEQRQIRNAHYLLGEIAFKQQDIELACLHFDQLARFYPDFPNLPHLLLAIDLRRVVNFKL